jgi:dihydrofolate reductase
VGRKLVLFIAASLDGYIADEQGGVGWLVGHSGNADPDKTYPEFIRTVDTLIMGRVTYEQLVNELSPGAWPYEGYKCYVATTRPMENTAQVEFFNGDICGFVASLKLQEGKDIWLVGGARLLDDFVKKDLIDRYLVTVIPVILGRGVHLFNEPNPQVKLHLDECTSANGLALLIYSRRGGG